MSQIRREVRADILKDLTEGRGKDCSRALKFSFGRTPVGWNFYAGIRKERSLGNLKTLHLILNIKNKMLLNDFRNKYPKADRDQFIFVNDQYGGYIKWRFNGITIMSNDDPTGKTWTDDLTPSLKKLLWKDLGLERSEELG